MEIDNTRQIFATSPGCTVSAWIRHNQASIDTIHTILAINGSLGANENKVFFAINGTLNQENDTGDVTPGLLTFYRNPNGYQKSSNVRIDDNEWHQVAFVYEKLSTTIATIELYVDGISQGDKLTIQPFDNGSTIQKLDKDFDFVTIGAEFNGNNKSTNAGDYFSGSIADFAIWDRALTDSEVSGLVKHSGLTAGSKGPIDLTQHSANSNLQVWYRMGDGQRSNLTDAIQNMGKKDNKEYHGSTMRVRKECFQRNLSAGENG